MHDKMNRQQREIELSGIGEVIANLIQERDKMAQVLDSHSLDEAASDWYKGMIVQVDKGIEEAEATIIEVSKKLQLLYHSVSI